MSYSLKKLELEMENTLTHIGRLNDNIQSWQEELDTMQKALKLATENVKDIDEAITKLKGETK